MSGDSGRNGAGADNAPSRIRPMALHERRLTRPTVSLASLLDGGEPHVGGECGLTVADYAREIEASGFPGIRAMGPSARREALDALLTRSLTRDLADELGVTVRRPASLRAWVAAYAAATSSAASWESIRAEAGRGAPHPPSKATAIRYREWLSATGLLDPVPAWRPRDTAMTGLTQGPKHHLADPALAARLMGTQASALLGGAGRVLTAAPATALGALFESLATLSVRVCAQSAGATTHHLRTERGDHEVDLIVERQDGHIVGIKVQLGTAVVDTDVSHLHWLRQRHGLRVVDLVVLTTGRYAFRRGDGVAIVPLGLLGP